MIKIFIITSLFSYSFGNSFQTALRLAIEAGLVPIRIPEQAFSPRYQNDQEVIDDLKILFTTPNRKVRLFEAKYRNLTYNVYSDLSTSGKTSNSLILDIFKRYENKEIARIAKIVSSAHSRRLKVALLQENKSSSCSNTLLPGS
jgi:hypothetical protein